MLWAGPAVSQSQNSMSYTPVVYKENKGQWDPAVLFKAELGGSTVYLRKTSILYQLFNKNDMDAIIEAIHGHGHSAGGDPPIIFDPSGNGKASVNVADIAKSYPKNDKIGSFDNLKLRSHSYEVNFIGANPDVFVKGDKAEKGVSNYLIGNNPSKWGTDVQSFQAVTYEGLYPNIDLLMYSGSGQVKYDLIVKPGGDVNQIRLEYKGAEKVELIKGQLNITTSVGKSYELEPYAYQYINNQRVKVKAKYELKGNQVTYKVSGKYDPNYPLILDPSVIFSTLTGSTASNWGYTATYDNQGNLYGAGIIFGGGRYPVSPGAISSGLNGGEFDIAVTKFYGNGSNIFYSTYLGGSGVEQPHSLFVDAQGNLVISGRTTSGDYPTTNGSTLAGGYDMVVTKLNQNGTGFIGSMYVGGSNNDGVNKSAEKAGMEDIKRNYGDDARSEVIIDNAGNIYVVGSTQSRDFPVTAGAFQPTFGGGAQDGVVVKIDPTCNNILWASFLGGSGNDAAFVIVSSDETNSIYVAGPTTSSNISSINTGINPNFSGGGCDSYIMRISSDGSTVRNFTYLQSSGSAPDMAYGVQLDRAGNVYAMGTTEGSWPIVRPTGTPTFYNDNSKQFIVKLLPDLSDYVYSTTFGQHSGKQPTLSPVAFLVDRCENVYVSGWGGGINVSAGYRSAADASALTINMPITRDAKSKISDGSDFYFFVMKRDALDILYGTYFGATGQAEHVDGGTSRFDYNGVIYQAICSSCNPNAPIGFPTTAGSYYTGTPHTCNLAVLKIAFNLDGVKASIKTTGNKSHFCSGDPITAEDTSVTKAVEWHWNWGDGTPDIVQTTKEPITHVYAQNGDYELRLIKYDPASCNVRDTAIIPIRIRSDRATLGFTMQRIGPCTNLEYQFVNTSQAPPGKPFTDQSFIWDLGDGTPPFYSNSTPDIIHGYPEGVYNISLQLVDTNYCNAPDEIIQQLRVAENVTAIIADPGEGCAPYTVRFNNVSKGGTRFEWDFFADGTIDSNDPYPTFTFPDVGTFPVKLTAYDPNTCNGMHDTTIYVVVRENPVAGYVFSPQQPVPNTPTQFTSTASGAQDYYWTFGDGDTSVLANPSHQFLRTGTYDVCQTVINQYGCLDTTCQTVSAIVVPQFDVPSAFSPNNDGLNDVFLVKVFGAVRFNMKIFNRWGQLVFESSDPNVGWDGKYKGALQSMDVYGYQVFVEFTDGTKGSRSGNVTLLR